MPDQSHINLKETLIQALRTLEPHVMSYLEIESSPRVTVQVAREFAHLSIKHLRLWCDVTRTAMRHIVTIPHLETLEVRQLTPPGILVNFAQAQSLKIFRCSDCLTSADLHAIATCQSLEELIAHCAELSPEAVDALAHMPNLQWLDLEGTAFDDVMAQQISSSTSIRGLYLSDTQITRQGLATLCCMQNLTELDLWSTALTLDDLELLQQLPHLEYLVLGSTRWRKQAFDPDKLVTLLTSLPALQRLWFDGMNLSPHHQARLHDHGLEVQITE